MSGVNDNKPEMPSHDRMTYSIVTPQGTIRGLTRATAHVIRAALVAHCDATIQLDIVEAKGMSEPCEDRIRAILATLVTPHNDEYAFPIEDAVRNLMILVAKYQGERLQARHPMIDAIALAAWIKNHSMGETPSLEDPGNDIQATVRYARDMGYRAGWNDAMTAAYRKLAEWSK